MTEFSIYEELMPKIRLLVSPPDAVNRDKVNANSHPYLKRRGKRRNHDYCDACGEKGNVLCCNICPASFHSSCHDPPIDTDEISDGWCCRACKYTPDQQTIQSLKSKLSSKIDHHLEPAKQKRRISESPERNVIPSAKKLMKLDTTLKSDLANNCSSREVYVALPYIDWTGTDAEIPRRKDSSNEINNDISEAFAKIIKESRKKNPKQFALPDEFLTGLNLDIVGADKDTESCPTDFDTNDLLKIPARKCYYCNGICLSGPMISCDFCSSHFHLNCLTPPLCSIPETKWMCPLHPHHILNKIMKNVDSITELSAWWNKLSQMPDPEIVKLKFTEKVRSLKKKRRKSTIQSATQIPDIIKYHYKHPPVHIPHLETLFDSELECVWQGDFTLIPHYLIDKSNKCCYESHALNGSLKNDSELRTSAASENNSKLIEIINEDDVETANRIRHLLCQISKDELSTWDEENKRFKFDSCGIYDYNLLAGLSVKNVSQNTKAVVEKSEDEMSPWQAVEHIVALDIERNFATLNVAGSVSLDETLKKLLVKERINRIIADLPPVLMPNSIPYVFSCGTSHHYSSNGRLSQMPGSKVKAVLCPLSHRAPLVYLYGNVLSIGKKFDNDVCLLNYGECDLLSDEHAVIFFDEMAKVYELMNYSDFGVFVDGIHYTCNVSADSSVKVVLESNIMKTSTSSSHRIRKRPSKPPKRGVENFEREKKTRSSVSAAETRSQCKKLFQKIDTISHKSHEIASIAEEDLNEIARNVKLASSVNPCVSVQESSSITEMPKPKKRGRPLASSLRNCERLIQDSNKKLVANAQNVTIQAEKRVRKKNKTKKCTSKKMKNLEALRRSNRRVERSMFASYHRDMKKVGDNEKENKIVHLPSLGEVQVEDNSTLDINQGTHDEEDNINYWIADRKIKCRCGTNETKFPIGRDDSWEISAHLHHGSYIRFGCIEFVFAVVNYPCPPEDRIYHNLKSTKANRTSVRPVDCFANNQDDLSSKLKSILNVLSSKMSNSSSLESSTCCTPSSRSSSPSCCDLSTVVPDHPDGIRLEI